MRSVMPALILTLFTSASAHAEPATNAAEGHQLKAGMQCPIGESCSASTPLPPPSRPHEVSVPNKPLPLPCAPGQKPKNANGSC